MEKVSTEKPVFYKTITEELKKLRLKQEGKTLKQRVQSWSNLGIIILLVLITLHILFLLLTNAQLVLGSFVPNGPYFIPVIILVSSVSYFYLKYIWKRPYPKNTSEQTAKITVKSLFLQVGASLLLLLCFGFLAVTSMMITAWHVLICTWSIKELMLVRKKIDYLKAIRAAEKLKAMQSKRNVFGF